VQQQFAFSVGVPSQVRQREDEAALGIVPWRTLEGTPTKSAIPNLNIRKGLLAPNQ